ncbi:asparaginase [Amycolatopsis acidiphila]|uniref:asparaginase n=1 Tax=Amycolatopsis acidiphila TaxID=715473 RepID=A0A557ZS58_9PSEU|nr:asparaginase [Amycolatopsis acidiphila]TVT14831.1 asparaginase [Amycolatopsis acidiphila]UIJ62071.1 asparaginase [Amycolatopsis acidiphila]
MGRVVVLSTGGTIASRQNGRGASVANDGVNTLVGRLPFDVAVPVEGRDVLRVGSYLLTPADMADIAGAIRETLADDEVLGVVVTHGTDTMEETAFLADLVHQDPRPVVFTGAQRPADAADTDGPRNLADAITVAADERARNRGVLITFDGAVFPARGTRKTQTLATAAFSSPDGGPIGQVREGALIFTAAPAPLPHVELTDLDVRVDIVALYPGVDTVALDAVVAAGAAGVVLEATGAGNGNPEIRDAVARLTAAGVVVALSTRVHAGPVAGLYGNGGGVDLIEAGAIPTGLLRPSQARILLTALLARHHDPVRAAQELARHAENPFGARMPVSLAREN